MLDVYSGVVLPKWIDYNGHMTDAAYLYAFGDGLDAFFRYMGDDEAYRATGNTFYTVETHLNYYQELKLGERFRIETQVVGCDPKADSTRLLLGGLGGVRDTQCGFKGFTRDAAHDLFAQQKITSIVFDVEVIYLARRRGYRMAIVPIRWSDKHGSRMHARPGLALRVAWDLFRIPLIHRGSRRSTAERG